MDSSRNARVEAMAEPVDVRAELILAPDHYFSGVRWRRRTNVRDEIGHGEIRLVSNAGDHWHSASGDGARDDFLVERPQILERPAAPGEDHHVNTSDLAD